ncbi:MAG: hypothetical protein QMD94_00700 [Candidatus Omnitrophota bacterium]|nr:hypothetical protein [Candidatus Omnitrophota bacterium]
MLRTRTGQAILEYIAAFIVVAIAVLVVFGAFNPEKLSIKGVFNTTITEVIKKINR